jgi:GT2 family glycosyltransferase
MMRSFEGEYYVSLDDDAWFLGTDELRIAIDYLESHATVGAVAFDILSPDRPQPQARSSPVPVSSFIGCGHVLRLAALRKIGYYEPNPGRYGGEEKDLCLRLLDAGWETHLLPGVHVWHEKTPLARDLPAQHRSGVCNDLCFALRRCPAPWLALVIPYKIVRHLAFSATHGLLLPGLAGIGQFFANVLAVWKSRAPVSLESFLRFARNRV